MESHLLNKSENPKRFIEIRSLLLSVEWSCMAAQLLVEKEVALWCLYGGVGGDLCMSSFAGATLIVHAYRDVANEDLRRTCMSILILG